MGAEELTPPEGFDKGPSQDFDEDVPTIDLEAGDVLMGTVVDTREGEGDYGEWVRFRINDEERGLVDYFAKGEAKMMYFADDLKTGNDVWIAKSTETETYNGNEYNPVKCRVAE